MEDYSKIFANGKYSVNFNEFFNKNSKVMNI